MPKYWGKQIFSFRRFPEVGQEKKKTDWTMVITMAIYTLQTPPRVVHASCLDQSAYHVWTWTIDNLHVPESDIKIAGRLPSAWDTPLCWRRRSWTTSTRNKKNNNTPGSRGGPGCRDRTLAVKRRRKEKISFFSWTIFLHISFSYAKILGETDSHPREFPRSGSKAKDRKRKSW